jgi:hypothetical protein
MNKQLRMDLKSVAFLVLITLGLCLVSIKIFHFHVPADCLRIQGIHGSQVLFRDDAADFTNRLSPK